MCTCVMSYIFVHMCHVLYVGSSVDTGRVGTGRTDIGLAATAYCVISNARVQTKVTHAKKHAI